MKTHTPAYSGDQATWVHCGAFFFLKIHFKQYNISLRILNSQKKPRVLYIASECECERLNEDDELNDPGNEMKHTFITKDTHYTHHTPRDTPTTHNKILIF